ncbi:MAG: purine-binding chemotaxis protein CheW [Archangiaceae bacterium]|nr:purine-binding chemotaxis protein CheW [Archangiaceae bacterium]
MDLTAAPRPHLWFQLGGEAYAVEVSAVREIIEYHGSTEVPLMPPHLKGVINLRGRVVPVVDLSSRFGRGATEVTRRTSVVILERHHATLGLQAIGVLVSAVTEVIELTESQIERPPAFGAAIRERFIAGIARHASRLIVMLDLAEVLAFDELAALGTKAA